MKTFLISFIQDGELPVLNVTVEASNFVEAIQQVKCEQNHVTIILSCVSL